MDLRDDAHTQVEDVIKTMRILAKLPAQPELVHKEITRWLEQAATVLEVFILPTIPAGPTLLDLRTGKQGNAHKVAELVGVAGPELPDAETRDRVEARDIDPEVAARHILDNGSRRT
jgi:hypothetical protein